MKMVIHGEDSNDRHFHLLQQTTKKSRRRWAELQKKGPQNHFDSKCVLEIGIYIMFKCLEAFFPGPAPLLDVEREKNLINFGPLSPPRPFAVPHSNSELLFFHARRY